MLVQKSHQFISRVRSLAGTMFPWSLAVVWLVLCQMAFHFIQHNQGLELSRALQAQFRSDLVGSDFEYLSRSVGDLELLGTIQCPVVEQTAPHRQVLLDLSFRGSCVKHPWLLTGGRFETIAQAVNGDVYTLQFSTQNQVGFSIGLWAMRLGGLVLLGAIYLFLRLRGAQAARLAKVRLEAAQNLTSLASQVSHDIRSPLSALSMVLTSLKELPEDKRLIIRNAAQRINDIANGLLQQSKKHLEVSPAASTINRRIKSAAPGPILLVALLDALVSEKRVQYGGRMEIEILGDLSLGYGLFARIDAVEIARVVSNLINNSVEALAGPGRVTVAIRGYKDQIAVIVTDNGKGIPPEILIRLGECGVSHGKDGTDSGSGLGVFHARAAIEGAGGKLSIQSQVGAGTMITISLPRAEAPGWFVEKIVLQPTAIFVSADDDQTIHQIWDGRLFSAGAIHAGVQHLKFSSLEQLESWAAARSSSTTIFLVDYEFNGQTGNGLDVIERLSARDRAILVTSRYEEPQIRERAERLGIKILPKALAPFVPLVLEKNREKYDAILIDDDSLVHLSWQMAAKENGRKLACFTSPEEFWQKASEIHLDSPIYIDVDLGNGVRGENVSRKAAEGGFTEIHLATGYEADSLAAPAWIRGIRGKEPPFG